jgi:DNA-cytosine methyltransferase
MIKKTGINVLSTFNGAGGAFMALNELNVPINKMYVSEIDKYANKAADIICPDNTHLGDITLWDEWEDKYGVDFSSIDILFGGFSCQSFSLAGKQGGTDDPRGALVYELLDIFGYIKALNPDVKFMFENVKMKKEFLTMLNSLFGVEPVLINSALLTAQNRQRNYWANWLITQPEDKGILLKDIIEGGTVDQKHNLSDKLVQGFANKKARYEREGKKSGFGDMNIPKLDGKCSTLTARYFKCGTTDPYIELRPCELRDTPPADSAICHHVATATDIKANEANKRIYADTGKSPTVTTMGGGHREPKVLIGAVRGRYIVDGKRADHKVASMAGKTEQRLEINQSEKSNCLTTVQKDNVLVLDPPKYRKLTPRECFRLQGFPENIIDKLLAGGISNSQLYKICGNGWTHPVIVHNIQCLLNTGWLESLGLKANP